MQNKQTNPFKTQGKLFLIPVPLSEDGVAYLPPIVIQKAVSFKFYFVEKLTTARRFLKAMDKSVHIDEITFSEIGRHDTVDTNLLEQWLKDGHDVGIMSEAGSPCVADPGSLLVAHAHKIKAQVVPLPGPNSMLLSLMASGFNGQSYRFCGYLPVKPNERKNFIKNMQQRAAQNNETQIFMETPFRNNQLFKDLLSTCKKNTLIGVASGLNTEEEFIRTLSIAEWQNTVPDLHKIPTVFTMFAR